MELLRLLASIHRHRIPMAVITVTVAALGALLAATQTPTYEVTSRIVLGPDEDIVEANDRIQVGQVLNHPVMAANLSEIITSDRVLSDAQWATAARDPEMEEIEVSALIAPESNVIEVVVSGPDQSLVVSVVEPITGESVVLFEEIYPVFRAEIIDVNPEPEVRQPVHPVLGAMIGAFVGLVLAVFTALFIDAVRRPGQLSPARSTRADATPTESTPTESTPADPTLAAGTPLAPTAAAPTPGDHTGGPTLAVVAPTEDEADDKIDLREVRGRSVRRLPPHPADQKPRARVEPAPTALDPTMFEANDDPGSVEGTLR